MLLPGSHRCSKTGCWRRRLPGHLRIAHVLSALAALALAGCAGGSSGAVAPPPGAPSGQPTGQPGGATPTPAPSGTPTPAPTATPAVVPATSVTPGPTVVRLGSYRVAPQRIFVAGISSGGFFGVQMHVAHARVFRGAAIYAGGVYHCAQDSVGLALAECGGQTVAGQALYQSTLAQSEAYLDQQSAAGTIDAASNLAGQPVYLWSGTRDSVVNPQEMADLRSEYGHYGTRIVFDNAFPADHGWESPDGEVPCDTAASPFMIACAQQGATYDSEQTWLSLFLGPLNARSASLHGSLLRFDQTEFGASASNSMDTNGTVYVPQPCAAGALCSFVVVFHGCKQGHAFIGDKFVTEAGVDEWADTNNVIVLYPYAVASQAPGPVNPNGCWDWWGYDDPNYSLKSGTQTTIVYRMAQRVTGAP